MIQQGKHDIASGATSVAVVFDAAFPAGSSVIVTASVAMPSGAGSNIFATVRDDLVTEAGFTAELSGPTPDANHKLNWFASAAVDPAIGSPENLILGNLRELKAAVLPPALAARTDWDDALQALGTGVAAAMQRHCNRLFARIEDDTFERSANCSYVSLPRFPIEAISAVELKSDEATGWEEQPAEVIVSINEASGLVEFGSPLGTWTQRVRVTYTGGFWIDTSEDGSSTLPEGAAAVPSDLAHAWHLQVQHEIEATNLLRGVAAKRPEDKAGEHASGSLQLIKRVREMLTPFVRYS